MAISTDIFLVCLPSNVSGQEHWLKTGQQLRSNYTQHLKNQFHIFMLYWKILAMACYIHAKSPSGIQRVTSFQASPNGKMATSACRSLDRRKIVNMDILFWNCFVISFAFGLVWFSFHTQNKFIQFKYQAFLHSVWTFEWRLTVCKQNIRSFTEDTARNHLGNVFYYFSLIM